MSSEIKDLFPHDEVRKGQDELINDMAEAFSKGKTLIAHAPTGLGKTASALTVAIKYAIEKKKKIFFLTNRHTQHQIAVETLKLMNKKNGVIVPSVDLIGKRWMCGQEISGVFGNDFNEFCKAIVEKGECEFYNNVKVKKGVTVAAQALVKDIEKQGALHNEEIMLLAKEKKMCSYEIAIEAAKKAQVIIGDYYYVFNPHVQKTLFNKIELELEDVILIVDEGHNLPGRVTDMISSNLTTNMIKNAVIEAKKFGYKGVIFWLQELMRIMQEIGDFNEREREKLVHKEDFLEKVKQVVEYDEFKTELELAADEIRKKQRRSYLGGIGSFLESWEGQDEGYTRIISEKKGMQGPFLALSYTCLDPGLITEDIFKSVFASVVMSGTLNPTSMYKDVLGVMTGIDRDYPSPFPPENKLSLIIPETSTKYQLRTEDMFKKIAEICSNLASSIPGNVAFFFPSYDLRDKVCYFFKSDKKKFWEKPSLSKEEKDVFIAGFKEEKDSGGVLLGVTGANFAEGIDLPGNLLNGVVIIGLPLGRPDLKTRETIKYYDQEFGKGWDYGYKFPAISKCIQSAGRCIRSGTDKGVVVFLDERFAWHNYYGCLPREGLIVSKDYEKLLKEFWGK